MAPIRQFLASERKRCACIFFVVEGEFEKDEKKTKKTKRCGGKSTARHLFRGPVPEKKRIASVIRAEKGNGSRGT